jgi:hypothetical protein
MLIVILIIIILALGFWGVVVLSENWVRKRLAAIPKESKQALESAKRASGACMEMCQAVSVTQSLVNGNIGNYSAKSNAEDGPGEEELMLKTKAHTLEALEKCLALSIEGINLTTNARYVLLRGLYRAAKAACRNCQPTASLEVCPAHKILEKVELET